MSTRALFLGVGLILFPEYQFFRFVSIYSHSDFFFFKDRLEFWEKNRENRFSQNPTKLTLIVEDYKLMTCAREIGRKCIVAE